MLGIFLLTAYFYFSVMVSQSTQNITCKIIILALIFVILSFAQELISGRVSQVEIFFMFLTTLVLPLYLHWLQSRINLNKRDLRLLLWLNLWIIGNVSNIIEGYFFTDFIKKASLVSGLLLTFVVEGFRSYIASYLLPSGEVSLKDEIFEYISNRNWLSLIARIMFGSLAYFPVYFFFGGLISPYVIEYYTRMGTGLKIPSFPTMIVVELLRGFLYVLCLFPVLVSTGGYRKIGVTALSGMLFIPGALLPLLNNQELPRVIIPYHMVEILADSVVYGYALSWILGTIKK